MRRFDIYCAAPLFAAILHYTCGQQCNNFVKVSPDDYDMNYYEIDNADARPLGFARGLVSYNHPETNTCSQISGVQGHTVEIMFETVPDATLLIRRNGIEYVGQNRYYDCQIATEDTIEVQFFCDTARGCSESDVLFWYRITASDGIDDDGHWCFSRDDLYPQNLLPLPTDLPTREPEEDGGNSAASLSVRITVVVSMLIIAITSL